MLSACFFESSPLTLNLGKYLRVPLIHSRITEATYRSVVIKVQQKLTAWKGTFCGAAMVTTRGITQIFWIIRNCGVN
ncbi:unnamed protein product [Prunus armeniaca]|uniref:Uncharacterized protein n=1 Tax=Prunus armeniaca TaxID=36596 RepID=A0A6J5WXT3_PRUAR|nr:unnamed protein product [Prunus armeniaca]